MLADAPALVIALEQSAFGAAIRQSTWIYPLANVAHIIGLALFAGSVAVLDLRLLGAFAATRPVDVVAPARRAAIAAFGLMALSGFILFTAEASHLALNPVFQFKVAAIVLGLANALVLGSIAMREAAAAVSGSPMSRRIRWAAGFSLLTWLTVAAAGRLIAYV